MVTMSHVATVLNLSRTTVSYALGDQWQTVGISPTTRDQILAKATELGYRRNPIAASLRTQITKTIGVVVPNISGDAYEHMLHGIESAVGNEYTLLLGISDYDANKERGILQSFHDRLVDGLIIVHAGCAESIHWIQQLQEFEIPVVQADRYFASLKTDVVEADNDALGFMLTNHFLGRGDLSIHFVRSPVVNNGTLARAHGYERAMQTRGLKPRLLPAQPVNSDEERVEFGYRHAREILRQEKTPFAIVAHDLSVGFGVFRAVKEAGCADTVHIGAVANDSQNPIYDFLPLNLTLAVWSVKDMGFHAGKLLLQRLRQSPNGDLEPQTVRIPCRLVLNKAG